jgi:ComF family protein
VASEYNEEIKKIIKSFKYERQRLLAKPLAKLLFEQLPLLTPKPIIVHVPTATTRMRRRGYDHANLLAKNLSVISGWQHLPALRRLGQARQVGARRATRLSQLEDAFWPTFKELVRGRHILLVDDIITTGATITACARQLKSAGAKSVSAVAVAHKS